MNFIKYVDNKRFLGTLWEIFGNTANRNIYTTVLRYITFSINVLLLSSGLCEQ